MEEEFEFALWDAAAGQEDFDRLRVSIMPDSMLLLYVSQLTYQIHSGKCLEKLDF